MRSTILLATLLALVLGVPAHAAECVPTTSNPTVDSGWTPMGRHYVDNDVCQPRCSLSIWWYVEGNGIDGLQRGDEMKDDTCGGMIDSDTLASY